jgi:hypothetical protein
MTGMEILPHLRRSGGSHAARRSDGRGSPSSYKGSILKNPLSQNISWGNSLVFGRDFQQ